MSNKIEDKVMVVRLTDGELLIGRMTIRPTNELTADMHNVMGLVEGPPKNKGETGQLALMPFLPFTKAGGGLKEDNKLEVFLANIQYMTEPVDAIKQHYEQVFNPSKIVKPTGDEIAGIMQQQIGDVVKGEKK